MSRAFIYDLDGTLVDSYSAILPPVLEVCEKYGYSFSEQYIYRYVTRYSVRKLMERVAGELELDINDIMKEFDGLNENRLRSIVAMPGAREMLETLTGAGHACFIYTHRGNSCLTILEQTKLSSYFTEVVTSVYGFPRKPAPDGILYLVEKYKLDPERSFYVGDRSLDIGAAVNAGIKSILYDLDGDREPAVSSEWHADYIIHDLKRIPEIAAQLARNRQDDSD